MPNSKHHIYLRESRHLSALSRIIIKCLLFPAFFIIYCPDPANARQEPFSPTPHFTGNYQSGADQPLGSADFSNACESIKASIPSEDHYIPAKEIASDVCRLRYLPGRVISPATPGEPELLSRNSLVLGRSRAGYLFTTEGANSARLQSQTGLLFGMGLAVAGIMWAMPEEYTGWDEEGVTVQSMLQRWWDNISSGPVWDTDDWATNYIGHAYSGLVYYQTARSSDYSIRDSFVYTTLMSTFFWEYGFEAFSEIPSIQDLIYTPLAGVLFGEAAYRAERAIIANDYQVLGYKGIGYVSALFLNPINYIAQGINLLAGREWLITGSITVIEPALRNTTTGSLGFVPVSPQMNLVFHRDF